VNLQDMIAGCTEDSKRWFPDTQSVEFMTLAMCGEAGEVANLVKKFARGSISEDRLREMVPEEIIDVLVYLCNIMGLPIFEGIDWEAIWLNKRLYNESRFKQTTYARLPQQVLAEAGLAPEQKQNWQTPGEFAS
jgi:NTP pyrophosphatase (non-canonical NTP hydrolase)